MTGSDLTITLLVNKTPEEAFNAINNVYAWWTENIEGNSQKLNDEFTVRFGDMHISKQKLVEFVPNKKVVWLVIDSKLNFLKDNKDEWTNTKIEFEISNPENQTQIQFTHVGLVPEAECYNSCTKGWAQYIGSLHKLLTEGKGNPALKAA